MDYPELTELEGYPFPVFISPGTEDRGRLIADRSQRAYEFLGSTLEFEPDLRVLVLAPEHWKAYATFPLYGMPHYTEARTIAMAGLDSRFWQSLLPAPGSLSHTDEDAMRAAYGQPDGSLNLSPFFDLLSVHEMGHVFHLQAACHFPRLWLMELFCNICLHAYVAGREPGQLRALETFPHIVAGAGAFDLQYRSLHDFELLYTDVGSRNYGWYQCRLHGAAKNIFDAGGIDTLRRLWKTFLRLHDTVTDDDLAAVLEGEVHPAVEHVLSTWPA
jgi:hypothetical protein